jgi:invasion protein IalB
MKILTSVLLVGFVMFAHQAIAKDDPPAEDIGNWKYQITYNEMTDDPSYYIANMSQDTSTFLTIGCKISKDGVANRAIRFFTSKSLELKFGKDTIQVQYRVDDKPSVIEDMRKKTNPELSKFEVISNSQALKLFSNLHDGKRLIIAFNDFRDNIETQKFDIKGFNEAFERIKGVCNF